MITTYSQLSHDKISKILNGYNDKISNVCHELFKNTPIKYFGYYAFYDDGQTGAYVTDPDITLRLLENNLTPSYFDLAMMVKLGMKSVFLSHVLPFPKNIGSIKREKYEEIISHAADRKSYHALVCIDRFPSYFRHCIFAVDNDDISIFSFYLNSYNCLQNFISYFESLCCDLMSNENSDDRIFLPNYLDSPDFDENSLNEKGNIENFNFLLPVTSKFEYDLAALTSHENECLGYLSKGYTMKITAKRLGISHRTVEQHLRNIKDKFGLNTKNQLVELWHEYFDNQKSESNL